VKQILEGDEVELLENNILCLSQLLETVRKDIRNIDSINDYLKDIDQFSKNSKLMKRLQFKLMDLLNLFK
jgi:archaellum component FlaC